MWAYIYNIHIRPRCTVGISKRSYLNIHPRGYVVFGLGIVHSLFVRVAWDATHLHVCMHAPQSRQMLALEPVLRRTHVLTERKTKVRGHNKIYTTILELGIWFVQVALRSTLDHSWQVLS